MATKSMSYDHPAYTTPYVFSGSSTVGANGATTKFAAFAAMSIKSITYAPNIVSTSASTPLFYSKSGTTTSTATLSALTSAAATAFNNTASITLAQGDQFWLAHGTDATVSLSVAVETVLTPGATITL